MSKYWDLLGTVVIVVVGGYIVYRKGYTDGWNALLDKEEAKAKAREAEIDAEVHEFAEAAVAKDEAEAKRKAEQESLEEEQSQVSQTINPDQTNPESESTEPVSVTSPTDHSATLVYESALSDPKPE